MTEKEIDDYVFEAYQRYLAILALGNLSPLERRKTLTVILGGKYGGREESSYARSSDDRKAVYPPKGDGGPRAA